MAAHRLGHFGEANNSSEFAPTPRNHETPEKLVPGVNTAPKLRKHVVLLRLKKSLGRNEV